jgi:hypothetical protein
LNFDLEELEDRSIDFAVQVISVVEALPTTKWREESAGLMLKVTGIFLTMKIG